MLSIDRGANDLMALLNASAHRGHLKIGDLVLLFYKADVASATESAGKSGLVLADLSG